MPKLNLLVITSSENSKLENQINLNVDINLIQTGANLSNIELSGYHCLIVEQPSTVQDDLLQEIRSSNDASIRVLPVFIVQHSDESPYLSDGLWLGQQHTLWLEQFYQRQQQLLNQESITPLDKLLNFWWPRQDFQLRAKWEPSRGSNYYYPLLDSLGISSPEVLMGKWIDAEIIRPEKLINRVRQCAFCQSQQLNYVDTCPSCKSIDIASTISLHCFTCGHIGGQAEFQENSELHCPTCSTRLRHIGVDYDRPLERFKCQSCAQHFIEGEVIAKCQCCQANHSPSELPEHRIYDYALGDAAFQIATIGRVFDNHALQWGEEISIDNFSWLTKWNNASAIRHKHNHVLLFLNWQGLAQSVVEIGERATLEKAEEIQGRLQAMIRKTDIFVSVDADKAILMLCHTSLKSMDIIASKIAAVEQANENSIIQLKIRNFGLPDKALPSNVQKWLLDQINDVELDHD